MRWRYPLILIAFAVVVFVVGLIYGVVMVGVPTQDPTPAIASAETRDVGISGWAMFVCACMLVVSVLWLGTIGVARLVRRPVVE